MGTTLPSRLKGMPTPSQILVLVLIVAFTQGQPLDLVTDENDYGNLLFPVYKNIYLKICLAYLQLYLSVWFAVTFYGLVNGTMRRQTPSTQIMEWTRSPTTWPFPTKSTNQVRAVFCALVNDEAIIFCVLANAATMMRKRAKKNLAVLWDTFLWFVVWTWEAVVTRKHETFCALAKSKLISTYSRGRWWILWHRLFESLLFLGWGGQK